MIDKTVPDAAAAVAGIPDGSTVMMGGFGRAGQPVELIDALIAQGAGDLTIVANNAGNGDTGLAALLAAERVRKIICSFPRQHDSWVFDGLYRAGEIELEIVPQGNLAERIRAAGAGIGAFFSPTGVGTELAAGKEARTIDGRDYVLEYPIRADFALISALKADRWGNLVYRETARNFGPIMASAATTTVVQVDEIVPLGSLDPETVVTPGIFVEPRRRGGRARLARGRCLRRGSRPGGPAPRSRRIERSSRMSTRISRDELAQRIAADIPEGAYVNLGIGAPTLVANFLPDDLEIILHTENGLLGMGPAPDAAHVDPDLINAGKQAVTALPGAAYFHHADSFGMMRGGHLDVCVLGAFQVSQNGDLANWSTGAPGAIPAVGGAMDLAIGAKAVYVMTDLLTKTGESKLVESCTYPLTGVGCVTRVYTDHAVFDVTDSTASPCARRSATTRSTSLAELTGLTLASAEEN